MFDVFAFKMFFFPHTERCFSLYHEGNRGPDKWEDRVRVVARKEKRKRLNWETLEVVTQRYVLCMGYPDEVSSYTWG